MGSAPDRRRRLCELGATGVRLAVILTLVLLALSTRLLPLSISGLPFNNDGISECRIASDIMVSGHLEYPEGSFYIVSHTSVTPAYDVLLATVASAIGVTPYDVAQFVTAIFSLTTVLGIYLISFRLTRSVASSLAAALTLSLLGTFVFLTGSTWKESLGVALLILVTYAYMNRSSRNMFALEVTILAVFPIVHHYVTLLAYLSLACLTLWSAFHAVVYRRLRRRHFIDLSVLTVIGAAVYLYYHLQSLDRLSYIVGENGFLTLTLSFLIILAGTMIFLMQRSHSKYTFSPLPATLILGVFVYDYFYPIFPYSQGSPVYVLALGAIFGLIIAFAWLGFEYIVESDSRYRAIPLGMLVPVLTLMLFAVLSGLDQIGHQILYRTLDFADPALAVGVACAVAFVRRDMVKKILVVSLVIILLTSFPFGYATNTLTGVRHDTQDYEVDSVAWVYSTSGHTYSLHSDERLSYIARAFYDYSKCPYLPSKLANNESLSSGHWYVMLEEWTTIGVNDYPNGNPVFDSGYISEVLDGCSVYYVGGPSDNNVFVFMVPVF